MPVTYYTSDEVDTLISERNALLKQVALLESMRPYWTLGYTEEDRTTYAYMTATKQMWEILGVNNQTEAMMAIKKLKGIK